MGEWLSDNHEWLFSGVGVALIVAIITVLKKCRWSSDCVSSLAFMLSPGRPDELTLGDIQSLPTKARIEQARILIIDDEEEGFPLEFLRGQGYSIEYWSDVENLPKLDGAYYDIIILDIVGVGRDLDAEDEGVAVLKHIKKVNPAQIVIAYSGQAHEPARIPFFKLADEYVPKPSDALQWKERLDHWILGELTIDRYWRLLASELRNLGTHPRRIASIWRKLRNACRSSRSAPAEFIHQTLAPRECTPTARLAVRKILALAKRS